MRWAVPGILPEGVTLFAGKPKQGKSWLAFDLAFETPEGGVTWEGPWEIVGALGESLGLWWGGGTHFPKQFRRDRDHFEAANWKSRIPKEIPNGS